MSASTLPALRSKLGTGGVWHSDFQTFVNTVNAMPTSGHSFTVIGTLISPALVYVTYPVPGINYGSGHGAAFYAQKTKDLLTNFYSVYPYMPESNGAISFSQAWGPILVYDWLYSVLTPAERTTLATFLKTTPSPSNYPDIFVSQTLVMRSAVIAVALALRGDVDDGGWSDTWLPQLNTYFGATGTSSFHAEGLFAGDTGSYSGQGMTYGFSMHLPNHLVMSEALRVATAQDRAAWYLGPDQRFLRYNAQSLIYHMRPWAPADSSYPGGRRYKLWQGEYASAAGEANDPSLAAVYTALSGAYKGVDDTQAGLAQWLLNNRTGRMGNSQHEQYNVWPLFKFVLGDVATPVNPDLVLPRNRVFTNGNVVLRSDFSTPEAPMVVFQARRFHGNQEMTVLGPGHFTIDKQGPAVGRQAGIGHGAGSSLWAHNFLAFPSRDIDTPQTYDDFGGFRGVGGRVTDVDSQWLAGTPFDTRGSLVTALSNPDAGRDVDYIQADLTRSYSNNQFAPNGNPARISNYVRQFVWFRGATPGGSSERFVVFDRASVINPRTSNGVGAIGAEWYFHFLGKDAPILNGSTSPLLRNGNTLGRVTSSDTTELTAVNTSDGSNVRTYLTPLLPRVGERKINLIGGAGPSGDIGQTDSYAHQDTYGKLIDPHAPNTPDAFKQYMGWGRVEVVSNFAAQVSPQLFLNVIEVGGSNATKSSTSLYEGTSLVAARVGDRIAVFNKSLGSVNVGEFVIQDAGTYGVHFANLTPGGEYEVTVNASARTHAADNNGTLYISLGVGSSTTVRIRATGVATLFPPGAPIGVRLVQ